MYKKLLMDFNAWLAEFFSLRGGVLPVYQKRALHRMLNDPDLDLSFQQHYDSVMLKNGVQWFMVFWPDPTQIKHAFHAEFEKWVVLFSVGYFPIFKTLDQINWVHAKEMHIDLCPSTLKTFARNAVPYKWYWVIQTPEEKKQFWRTWVRHYGPRELKDSLEEMIEKEKRSGR